MESDKVTSEYNCGIWAVYV